MDCVNHTGVNATAYCQSCGKALCAGCVRNAAGGQILCEPCWTAWHTCEIRRNTTKRRLFWSL